MNEVVVMTIAMGTAPPRVLIVKRRLSTYLDGKVVQQLEPSLINKNDPIKPDSSYV